MFKRLDPSDVDRTPFKVYSPFWKNSERIFLEKIPNKDHKVKKLKKM